MAVNAIAVHVRYHNILRNRAGVDQETVTLPAGASIRAVLEHLADRHGPVLRETFFTPAGDIVSYLVIFRNRQLVGPDEHRSPLADGDELLLFPAVSGG